MTTRPPGPRISLMKRLLDRGSSLIVAPCALACRLEAARNPELERIFTLCAQTFALVPGFPGVFLRRAFYRATLSDCSLDFFIGFGSVFTHRAASVGQGVYIGPYAVIGSARLGEGCLIGSRASILSGRNLHELNEQGHWTPADLSRLHQTVIGAHAWVGEAAVVVADVGAGAMLAAGAVVAAAVPPGIMVAGNPARFVRHLRPQDRTEPAPAAQSGEVHEGCLSPIC